MKFKNLAYLSACAMIVLASCKKDDPVPPPDPDPVPSAAQLSSFFSTNNSDAVQNFTIDATQQSSITGSQGTVITFWANSFEDGQGTTITGNVDIELTEIYTKKDMIFLNKQTLGNNMGTLTPLESGGEFLVTASQGGNEVFLKSGWSYNVQVQAPLGTNPNMDQFYASGQSGDTLVWNPSDSSFWADSTSFYDMYFDSLGWINCDVFMSDPGPFSTVEVDVPDGYTNNNCAVFISFDGMNSMTYVYGYENNNFTTGPYYELPIGLNIHIIALAFINNSPYAAIQGTTVTSNHLEVISSLTQTTDAQLATDIQNLP